MGTESDENMSPFHFVYLGLGETAGVNAQQPVLAGDGGSTKKSGNLLAASGGQAVAAVTLWG